MDRAWLRELLRLVTASDDMKIQQAAVADHLSLLNDKVHAAERSVGPRCIVVWRGNPNRVHRGGGGNFCYTNGVREAASSALPHISNGRDMEAFFAAVMPDMFRHLELMMRCPIPSSASSTGHADRSVPPRVPLWSIRRQGATGLAATPRTSMQPMGTRSVESLAR